MTVKLKIIHTSDIHGCFFPFDFIHREKTTGSVSRISTVVKRLRNKYGENLILLDSGDFIEGQPTCDFNCFHKPLKQNLAIEIAKYMRYDCMAIGNHDIELGHTIYDDFVKRAPCPILGANVIDVNKDKPYFTPYSIIKRQGVKIAIVSMVTTAVPYWLDKELWAGLKFTEVIKTTKELLLHIKQKENPDILIGLFHSGWKGGISSQNIKENCIKDLANEICDFDLILFGHDHRIHNDRIKSNGKDCVLLNPSSDANHIGVADIVIDKENKVKHISGKVISIENVTPDKNFIEKFKSEYSITKQYSETMIGHIPVDLNTRDCFFGDASLNCCIHRIQMDVTKADISLTAPLAFDETLKSGPVYVSDLFRLYKYDNCIYLLSLTGQEIKDLLEMSYELWIEIMPSKDSHIMKIMSYKSGNISYSFFKNLVFNFDTAAGIKYNVDVTKVYGKRIDIISTVCGDKFDLHRKYKVAMHSYRGNGGAELLTKGAGISQEKIEERVILKSKQNLRFYLEEYISKAGNDLFDTLDNWKFIPENWTIEAIKRDRRILFGTES